MQGEACQIKVNIHSVDMEGKLIPVGLDWVCNCNDYRRARILRISNMDKQVFKVDYKGVVPQKISTRDIKRGKLAKIPDKSLDAIVGLSGVVGTLPLEPLLDLAITKLKVGGTLVIHIHNANYHRHYGQPMYTTSYKKWNAYMWVFHCYAIKHALDIVCRYGRYIRIDNIISTNGLLPPSKPIQNELDRGDYLVRIRKIAD